MRSTGTWYTAIEICVRNAKSSSFNITSNELAIIEIKALDMDDDAFARDVDDLHNRYSTIPELILLLKQLRLNDPTVKQVCIQWRKLPTAYINTFFSLLSVNTAVTHLKLSQCNIMDEAVSYLTNFIEHNRTVVDLDLSRNFLSDLSAGEIADSLVTQTSSQRRPTLRKLSLHGNHFTEIGMVKLCSAIPSTKIQVLKIGKMPLGDVGALGVAEMLMDASCPLRKLDLRSNSLGSTGASIISRALGVNESLEVLCLGKNNIDDVGIKSLVDALQRNKSLRTLDVQYNQITDVGANHLVRCLDDSNYTLRKLKLRHCDEISSEMKEMLLDILVMNSYGPELAFKTKDAIRSVLFEEYSCSDYTDSTSIENKNHIDRYLHPSYSSQSSYIKTQQQALSNLSSRKYDETCVICYESAAECILLPCRHRNCCSQCAQRLKSCHMCREVIVKIFRPLSKF